MRGEEGWEGMRGDGWREEREGGGLNHQQAVLDVKAIEVCCTRRRGAQGRKENQERKGQQKQI